MILPEAPNTRTCEDKTLTRSWRLCLNHISFRGAELMTLQLLVICCHILYLYVSVCACVCVCTSAGNSFRSTVCSEPQALLSPQWKWNWHSLNLSCRGPPFSAAPRSGKTGHSVSHWAQYNLSSKKRLFFFNFPVSTEELMQLAITLKTYRLFYLRSLITGNNKKYVSLDSRSSNKTTAPVINLQARNA